MINSNHIWEGVPLFGNDKFDYSISLSLGVIYCRPFMTFESIPRISHLNNEFE